MSKKTTKTDFSLPKGTHTVAIGFGDLNGIMRGKRVHADHWKNLVGEGMGISLACFVLDMTCDIWDTPYCSMENGYPDMHVFPMTKPVAVPWEEGVAFSMGRAVEVGTHAPVVIDPREVLLEQLDRAKSMGFEVTLGAELEFYLLDNETLEPFNNELQVYSLLHAAKCEHVVAPIRNHINALGIPIEQSNPEYAPGQIEVNLRYGPAREVADNVVLFRNFVREIAWHHGYNATFMGKPFHDQSGSGFHTHYSLWKGGKNVFADGKKLSKTGKSFVAGMQQRMAEMTLVTTSTANSFRRRAPYTFCPTNNSWGVDNRTVGLRVFEGSPNSVRVEKRDGSADCNPYYMIAAELAAGLDGIEKGMEPTPIETGDAYQKDAEYGGALPSTPGDAIKQARASKWLKSVMGDTRHEIFCQQAERELEFCGKIDPESPVTDTERERYIRNL